MKKDAGVRLSGFLLFLAGFTFLLPAFEMMQKILGHIEGSQGVMTSELFWNLLVLMGMASLLVAGTMLDAAIGIGVMRLKKWAVYPALPISAIGFLVFRFHWARVLFVFHLLVFGMLVFWGVQFLRTTSPGAER